jgi:hypothetical protein
MCANIYAEVRLKSADPRELGGRAREAMPDGEFQ